MSDMLALARPPKSVEDVIASIGLTDCDLDSTALDDGAALLELGITRSVQRHVPPASDKMTAEEQFATRFVVDALPADDDTLQHLHRQGVRGVRYVLADDDDALRAQFAGIDRDAERIAALDWHVELAVGADLSVLVRHQWELLQLPVALCLDDVAPAVARLGIEDEHVGFLLDLLHMGRTWIKLGGAIAYDELRGFVNAALAVRSDRLLWGSGGAADMSDRGHHVATRLAVLERLIPDEDDRAAVLVANPARLYGFAA
jgi:predicted TIM-barrel fold metal-dependent hydrolase